MDLFLKQETDSLILGDQNYLKPPLLFDLRNKLNVEQMMFVFTNKAPSSKQLSYHQWP